MLAKVALHQDRDGIWIAECLNMPGCVSEGETEDQAIEMLQAAIKSWLEVMREDYPDLDSRLLQIQVRDVEVAA